MSDHISVIDLTELLLQDAKEPVWERTANIFYKAMNSIGFVYLSGHGISKEKIQNASEASKKFFDLPKDVKLKYMKEIYSGYLPGDENFHPSRIHELRELYDYCGPTVWPDQECPELQISMNALKEECNHLARILFKLLAKALGVEDDFFYTQHLGMYSDAVPSQYTQRTLHYPPVPSNYEEIPGAIRCCEHTDYGTVTLLFQDETGGLEVQTVNKEWIPAVPIPDTILINAGDLLELWSGGQFPATPHRVRIPDEETKRGKSRYCMSYFIYPDMAANVTPLVDKVHPKFGNPLPVINAGEYFTNRIDYTFNVELKAGVNAVPGYFNNT